jgi:hypothetical protein
MLMLVYSLLIVQKGSIWEVPMRFEMARHLSGVRHSAHAAALAHTASGSPALLPPPEMNWRQYAIYLLSTAAEIEHALMVQYLYAAYSIDLSSTVGGADPAFCQRVILGVAKEEMGHLITVQNVLRLLGAPLHLERDDYPVRSPFYPYMFHLEPVSLKTLAKFVVAESPEVWPDWVPADEKTKIVALATDDAGTTVVRVGELYAELIRVLSDSAKVPDNEFRGETYPYQASFDEYGRGYAAGARGDPRRTPPAPAVPPRFASAPAAPPRTDPQLVAPDPNGSAAATPDVLVVRAASRTDAVAALRDIAEQGEAIEIVAAGSEDSHFVRFLNLFRRFDGGRGAPSVLPLAVDPIIGDGGEDSDGQKIRNPEAATWAALFNTRYRMLLAYLAHVYRHRSIAAANGAPGRRGQLINRMFGEMYNLKSIASLLTALSLDRDPKVRAGPPFQIPYTVALPDGEPDIWRLHRDLLDASLPLAKHLATTSTAGANYARALLALDERARSDFDLIISGLPTAAQVA